MPLVEHHRNLSALPSFHYHPVFGRELGRILRRQPPSVIALEIGPNWAAEFQWGVSCWPCPTVSYAGYTFLPIVPGDSMVEACRLGMQARIPIEFVDLDVDAQPARPESPALPDPAFAPRVGRLFLAAVDALDNADGAPADADLAREARMAARLDKLMQRHERVLWVGGMAHWTRIRRRLQARDFSGPDLAPEPQPATFLRMRLGHSALHRLSGRLPFQVASFARDQARYSETACLQKLALAAVKPEKLRASEVAAMLRYARNLAAREGIRETPALWELLASASAMLGNAYAGRLAALALQDHHGKSTDGLPTLAYEVVAHPGQEAAGLFKCEGQVLAGIPLKEPPRSFHYRPLPSPEEVRRRRHNQPADGIAADATGRKRWCALPDEEASYEAFVRYVLDLAGRSDTDESVPVPMSGGMADGIDLRATIRHWHSGDIYVRQPERGSIRVTNGLIDFTARSERERAGNDGFAGWADPDLPHVGSVSCMTGDPTLLQLTPFKVLQSHRQLSLITLDSPTWARDQERPTFYSEVIRPLLALQESYDHDLYAWLRVMFEFCRNKPFAYCSRYRPSARIRALGREYRVQILHLPLRRIARPLLEKHQSFRLMHLTRPQWDELLPRLDESRRAWVAGDDAVRVATRQLPATQGTNAG